MEIEKSMKGNLFSSYLKSYFQTIQIKEDFLSFLEDHSSENWLSSNILIKYRIAGENAIQYHGIEWHVSCYLFLLI